MRIDATLLSYCFVLALGLVSVFDLYDPEGDAGAAAASSTALRTTSARTPAGQNDLAGCRISYVVDGDTLRLDCNGSLRRARLTGYDSPELSKPQCASEKRAAEAARKALERYIDKAGQLELQHRGTDKYRRDLVTLRLDGQDVAQIMIARGHGRAYGGGKRQGWCD